MKRGANQLEAIANGVVTDEKKKVVGDKSEHVNDVEQIAPVRYIVLEVSSILQRMENFLENKSKNKDKSNPIKTARHLHRSIGV